MVAQEFQETGWQFALTGHGITRYQVMGERSSGTNFVKRLIGKNTALAPTEELGWKHGFPMMTAIPADTAIVCIVRHAGDWARSMHMKPWHCPPEMQRLGFSDFLRAEWETVADRPRYFPQVAALGGQGRPLQHDRDPITGRPFANIFALRRAKLQGLLGYFDRGCSLILVRLEAVQGAPQLFLDDLAARLSLERPGPFEPVHKRLGARFLASVEHRPPTPPRLTEDDRLFLQSQLDLGTEAALGYRY
ncbi:hypothetical protein [Salipiger sp.]|uniref:hypothetical protein n=1 Tax=Salipiger sp. TaxID=2078585 RepID=UPI003A977311